MKKYITKKTILALGLITLISIIIAVIFTSKKAHLTIISSLPASKTQNVRLGLPIILELNQAVNASLIKVQSTPEENWDISNRDQDTVILSHKLAFHPNTTYNLEILSEDKIIYSLEFTTEKSQGDIRLIQTIEEKMKEEYPLSKQTPYIQPNYLVVYSVPMTLEITLKNPNLTSAEVIAEVKSWVTSVGGDASAHKYVIGTDPLPSPTITNLIP